MKRFFRKALIGLAKTAAVLIVLLVIFYAEEDWRGARNWAACQKSSPPRANPSTSANSPLPANPKTTSPRSPSSRRCTKWKRNKILQKRKSFMTLPGFSKSMLA